jgi:hypothetical protein
MAKVVGAPAGPTVSASTGNSLAGSKPIRPKCSRKINALTQRTTYVFDSSDQLYWTQAHGKKSVVYVTEFDTLGRTVSVTCQG